MGPFKGVITVVMITMVTRGLDVGPFKGVITVVMITMVY